MTSRGLLDTIGPVRDWLHSRWRSVGLIAAAMWLANFALSFYGDRESQAWWPVLWPTMFVVAAALVLIFLRMPGSVTAYKWAGVSGFLALGGQAVRVATNALSDGLDSTDWSRWAGIWLWAGAAVFWAAWWMRAVGPYHHVRRYGFEPDGTS